MKKRIDDEALLTDDPHWYKDAIIYELHVRSFFDSSGDGIGDFRGLVNKLDYLQDLGVTALWLLPFYPSPLRDDGYDIADYTSVNPAYGSLKDFKLFLKQAHRRGLRVITELVINHTSAEHPWFQRARRAPAGSKYRDFYVWSESPDRYKDTRIIFKDFEASNWTWDPVAKAYFWHRFYSHQPDLNFDNPEVQKAVFKSMDFWLGMGVDGLRLDAVPYLYEREGTNCENLPETHQFLKRLRGHIDNKFKNKMLLAEANQWPEDAAEYFGDGDECHMNFHFPLMPRMFMSVQLENNFPVIDISDQTPAIHPSCQWAVFLRNHDELTLEMVTDEDRDYMYRVYASDPQARINLGIRRRLAPLLKVRRKIELMNGLLFSLPGTPVLYYGDEIGMGDNIYLGDRDGVRTPMQWSGDRNAGFSGANPQKLFLPVIIDPEYHFESHNVEAQQNNPSSLLWWMKRIIALRKQYQVFGRGSIEFLHPDNNKVLAFLRRYEDQTVLIVANLSRFCQYVELDLRQYDGMVPVELFGWTHFPPIGELPYLLTLTPHAFYWFLIEKPSDGADEAEHEPLPTLKTQGKWDRVLAGRSRGALEKLLADYMPQRRWFRGKARKVKGTSIVDAIAFTGGGQTTQLLVVQVDYLEGGEERYVLPLGYATGATAKWLEEDRHYAIIAQLQVNKSGSSSSDTGFLYDATVTEHFAMSLLRSFERRKSFTGETGQVTTSKTRELKEARAQADGEMRPVVSGAEQSNTSIIFGEHLILKLFRVLEDGINPDLELTQFLTQKAGFAHTPAVAGALTYEQADKEPSTLGVMQRFVPNQGDAWKFTLDALQRYYDRALGHLLDQATPPTSDLPVLARAEANVPDIAGEMIGAFLPLAELLGQRTAQMHKALGSEPEASAFAPEAFSTLYQRSLYQSARSRLTQTFQLLRKSAKRLPEEAAELAREVLDRQSDLDARLKAIVRRKIEAVRIRHHGDYHLGQVLWTGKDFVIIDFEGEPARPIGERRFKRSPLRDVAGMLRSFQYATAEGLRHIRMRPEDARLLEPWGAVWHQWVSAAFVRAYLAEASDADFVPQNREDLEVLLDFYLVDKCVYELGYELNNRPNWVKIPLLGLQSLESASG